MARRRGARSIAGSTGPSVNLTPLLDIIFNLIFFFILATNIRERRETLEITLPQARTGEEAEQVEQRVTSIVLAADGRLTLDGEPIAMEALADRLRALARDQGLQQALVSSDAQTPFQLVIDVAEICEEAGIAARHHIEGRR